MTKTGWILLGIGAGVAIYGVGVYHAANNVSVGFGGGRLSPLDNSTPQLALKITNKSPFGIPVPVITGTIYDSNGTNIGTISSPGWQYVPGNSVTNIYINLNLNSSNLVTDVTTIINNIASGNFTNLPTGINIVGKLSAGPFAIPFSEGENLNQLV